MSTMFLETRKQTPTSVSWVAAEENTWFAEENIGERALDKPKSPVQMLILYF